MNITQDIHSSKPRNRRVVSSADRRRTPIASDRLGNSARRSVASLPMTLAPCPSCSCSCRCRCRCRIAKPISQYRRTGSVIGTLVRARRREERFEQVHDAELQRSLLPRGGQFRSNVRGTAKHLRMPVSDRAAVLARKQRVALERPVQPRPRPVPSAEFLGEVLLGALHYRASFLNNGKGAEATDLSE